MTLDAFMRTRAFEGCLRRLDIAVRGDVIIGRAELGRILYDLVECVREENGAGGAVRVRD